LERVDPRVNPNLLLDETQQEFWNNISRKPYAKAILRAEEHWKDRRRVWLQQYERVEIMNQVREELAEELEGCAPEMKRLLAPIMVHRITEISLWNCLREARQRQVSLSWVLEQPRHLQQLRSLRAQLDQGGAAAAARLLSEFSARAEEICEAERRTLEARAAKRRVEVDSETMCKHLNMAQKLRKDGYIEWHRGSVEEALASWRQAEAHLRDKRLGNSSSTPGVRVPGQDVAGNETVEELHLLLLKNVAQAAIRLGRWSEALAAADDALAMDDQDHKVWFRRACCLEGLGRYAEEEEALARIDDLAVGRPDRARLARDVQARRQRIAASHASQRQTERLGLQRALARGVFSADREAALCSDAGVVQELRGEEAEVMLDEDELLRLEEEELLREEEELFREEEEEELLREEERQPRQLEAPSLVSEASFRFRKGDRVIARQCLADIVPGEAGTVLEVDADGDIKVIFDGQSESQLVFSIDFDSLVLAPSDGSREPTEIAELLLRPQEGGLRLTQDGAAELLDALARAYQDTGFQQQLAKLARDVRWDRQLFSGLLPKVALEVQRPLLRRWGFEASPKGATEMQRALEEAALGAASEGQQSALKEQAAQVTRLLYGDMYEGTFASRTHARDHWALHSRVGDMYRESNSELEESTRSRCNVPVEAS
ncbi:unnamed protein product, partial [Polarella glacialis]